MAPYGTASMISTTTVRPFGRLKARGLANLLARDRRAKRRLRRVHVNRSAALFSGREQEGHLGVLTLELDRHGHARAHDTVGTRRFADLRVRQDVGELVDSGLLLALLLLGGVVSAVLLQVALIPSRLDLLGDVDPALTGEVIQLGLEPVVRLLGKPGDSVVTSLGHKHSSKSAVRRSTPPGPAGPLHGGSSSRLLCPPESVQPSTGQGYNSNTISI